MSRFVLDASIALAWFIDRPVAPYAVHVGHVLEHGGQAVVPGMWRIEVSNGLVIAERRAVLTPSDAIQALQRFELLLIQSIETAEEPVLLRRVFHSARQFGLTAYDACYLVLAQNMQLPLATLDRRLKEAALKAGVALFV